MEINGTIFIQLIIFLSLLLFLSNSLFLPILSLFEKRDHLIKDVRNQAISLRDKAEKIGRECDDAYAIAVQEAKKELAHLKYLADKEAQELLLQAKNSTLIKLKKHEEELVEQENAVKNKMDAMSELLAKDILLALLARN